MKFVKALYAGNFNGKHEILFEKELPFMYMIEEN